MSDSYTKSEIDLMHNPMNEKLDKILVQTTKHNGRLSKAEKWINRMGGGLTLLTILVVPVLISITINFFNNKGLAKSLIEAELSRLEINIVE